MVTHAYNSSTQRYRQEEQAFMAILDYTASSKSEWSTKDPVSNKTWGGGNEH